MAFIHVVEDEEGHVLAELYTTHDKYALGVDMQMFVPTQAAWCRGCNAFTLVESLGSAEHLKEHLRGIATRRGVSGSADQPFWDRYVESRWAEVTLWQASLQSRLSPARCLECGGHDFTVLNAIRAWLDDPGCPGRRIRVQPSGHACMARSGRLYDVEGRRVEGGSASR